MRRALSHVGGEIELDGDRDLAEKLGHAIDVPPSIAKSEEAGSLDAEQLARVHVHGFHSYPARMHPITAARLVEAFSSAGDKVLDPFAGSGTVLVEAALAGRAAIGIDANPLAVRLADRKLRPMHERERQGLISSAREVAEVATARRKAKTGASKRYGREDMALYAPHVLLELDGLRVGLDELPGAFRADLELVLSSILSKLQKRGSDTSERGLERRIAAGYPARLFVKKTEELCAIAATIADRLAAAPRAKVMEGDARELTGIGDRTIAVAITSPPYPGNYDYLAHHGSRLRWLRLPSAAFDEREIGARRKLDPLSRRDAMETFSNEMFASLRALHRVLVPHGRVVLLLADSVVAAAPLFAIDLIDNIAPRAGFRRLASASQPRPHFHGPTAKAFAHRPRREHAVLLARI